MFYQPKHLSVLLLTISLSTLAGCGNPIWLPRAHKIEIQQGNLISEAQRQRLREGQTKQEVLDILGQPVLEGSFRANRWDYVFSKGPAGTPVKVRKLTIVFENELLTSMEDNFETVSGEIDIRKPWWQRLRKSEG